MFAPRQRGAVLVVSLLMLLVMTVLAVSTIDTSNINFQIINNLQSSLQNDAAAQRAIELTISDIATFTNPGARSLTIEGQQVNVSRARCRGFTPGTGFSAKWGLAPEETVWELTASASDPVSGASASSTQGVRILMTAGSCAAAEPAVPPAPAT